MKGKRAAAAILLLSAQANADPADWSHLTKFAGTYPAAGLMKSPLIKHEITALLTPNQQALLSEMSVSPPISLIGPDLLAQFCLPHDCGAQSAALIIDPAAQTLWFGFYDNHGQTFHTNWSATADPATIPSAILDQLAKIHSPF